MSWTLDALGILLAPDLYRYVRMAEGEADPIPFVTLSTHDQDYWAKSARAVINVLARPTATPDDALFQGAAEHARKHFGAIRGGKL